MAEINEFIADEHWKPVLGYEGRYEVSDKGRVKSLSYLRTKKPRILANVLSDGGYLCVSLFKNGKEKVFRVHRLVYEAFVGKIPEFIAKTKGNDRWEINHINEIKTDNRLENLELITCTQNNNYGSHKKRIAESNSRKVCQYSLDGVLIKVWSSIKSCGEYGFNPGAIGACCRNEYCRHERCDYKGFIWRYFN